MLKSVAGLILYDGYALSLNNKWIKWQRTPDLNEFEIALTQNTGLLFNQAIRLANSLKVLSIFTPYIYVYPYWLLNNPLLMILSNLAYENPNNISPLFREEFFRIYWGIRERHSFSELFNETYPEKGSPNLPRNSSWIDDIYHDPDYQRFFNQIIRRPLSTYVDSCLVRLDHNFESSYVVNEDPMRIMMEQAKDLSKRAETWEIPGVIKSKEIQYILDDLIEYFDSKESLFVMTEARQRWREQARMKNYNWCLRYQDWVDWFIRDNIYLPSHAEAVNSIALSYNKESASTKSIEKLVAFDTYHDGEVIHIDKGSERYLITVNKRSINIEDYLDKLSFRYIFNDIKTQAYYKTYNDMLEDASNELIVSDQIRKIIGAQCYLLGCICPELYKQTGIGYFKDKGIWKAIGWDIDHSNGVLFGLVGAVTNASLAAASVPADVPRYILVPVAIILGALAGNVIGLVRNLPQIDTKIKKARGKKIMMPFAKFE